MHPTLFPRPFHHEGWIYEEKIDGYRMVAYKASGAVQLISRNGRDHTKRFPELAKALTGLKAKTLTLDGEVAVFDRRLVSRFEWLRSLPKDEPSTSPVYIAFDVLELDGHRRSQHKHPPRQSLHRACAPSPARPFPARWSRRHSSW
jgi:bifunctional non-homologous end joining protein LigD